ncbi:hypothetical protein JCM31826_02040 [Thermaurantimonas aggregans]|uniref:Uncharacterized protein n=1 Tax=Thermaurantimonas aggregans TaxID=2173829 RepID=A0A401XI87_9FLAO|nr:hypothetical protein JCM31826_02040 [Thermaurantimonas aggregans]
MKYLNGIRIFQKANKAIGKSQLEVCGAATITVPGIIDRSLTCSFHPNSLKKREATRYLIEFVIFGENKKN